MFYSRTPNAKGSKSLNAAVFLLCGIEYIKVGTKRIKINFNHCTIASKSGHTDCLFLLQIIFLNPYSMVCDASTIRNQEYLEVYFMVVVWYLFSVCGFCRQLT